MGNDVWWVEECMEERSIMGKETCWRVGMRYEGLSNDGLWREDCEEVKKMLKKRKR